MIRFFSILCLLALHSATAKEAAFPSQAEIEQSITRGVDFLLSHQNKNGSWGGPTRTKGLNIYAPAPEGHQAFHVASSALALQGLIESKDQRPAAKEAIKKAEAWLLKELPNTRSIDPDATYNTWAHAYGLRALCSLYRNTTDPDRQAIYKKQALIQIKKLHHYENVNGGWGYLNFKTHTPKPSGSSTSFMTATSMLALHDAKVTMGIKIPKELIQRSLSFIKKQRTPDFCYVYSREHRYWPQGPINRPAGSLGRSQACNAAARAFGDKAVTDKVLHTWLQRLTDRQGWLDHGRKRPIPHEAPAAVAGYFYYYGHYYASECILLLPKDDQAKWKHQLAALIVPRQEANGSWWDYPLYNYHYAYGTGFALSTLARCRQ